MGYSCKGQCPKWQVGLVGKKQANYQGARKYCSCCAAWVEFEGRYCPCCGNRLRHKAAKYKAQYRRANEGRI